MKKFIFTALIILNVAAMIFGQSTKAPAFPLITHDPYFSIWSTTDKLADSPTKHWTGAEHSMMGMLKVDNKMYRFMGNKGITYRDILPAGDVENYMQNIRKPLRLTIG